jgi:hypothetical protein
MALEISYWTQGPNKNMYGRQIVAETRTLSGTSARSAATPSNAEIVRIEATEAARISYTSSESTATATTPYLASGATIEIEAVAGWKVAGKTA